MARKDFKITRLSDTGSYKNLGNISSVPSPSANIPTSIKNVQSYQKIGNQEWQEHKRWVAQQKQIKKAEIQTIVAGSKEYERMQNMLSDRANKQLADRNRKFNAAMNAQAKKTTQTYQKIGNNPWAQATIKGSNMTISGQGTSNARIRAEATISNWERAMRDAPIAAAGGGGGGNRFNNMRYRGSFGGGGGGNGGGSSPFSIDTDALKAHRDAVEKANEQIKKNTKSTSEYEKSQLALQRTMAALTITYHALKKAMIMTREASQFEADMRRTARILGESGEELVRWQQTVGKTMGLSRQDFATMAATFSNLNRSFSKDAEMNAKITGALIKEVTMLAERQGRAIEDITRRFRSGILGQTEAIDDLGIEVKISMIESTKAFKKFAGDKSWDQLSFQTQQLIRVFAILEQSQKQTMGGMEATTTLTLNQLSGAWKDFSTNIGQGFLNIVDKIQPAIMGLVSTLDWLGEGFKRLTGGDRDADNYSTLAEKYGDATSGLADDVEDANKKLSKNIMGFDELNLINKTLASGAGADNLWKNLDKDALDYMDSILGEGTKPKEFAIKPVIENIGDMFTAEGWAEAEESLKKQLSGKFGEEFRKAAISWGFDFARDFSRGYQEIKNGFPYTKRFIKEKMDDAAKQLAISFNEMQKDVSEVWTEMKNGFPMTKEWVEEKWENVHDSFLDEMEDTREAVSQKWGQFNTNVDFWWGVIRSTIHNKIGDTKTNTLSTLDGFKQDLSDKWNKKAQDALFWWSLIKGVIKGKINETRNEGKTWLEDLRQEISTRWERMHTNAGFWWELIKLKIENKISNIANISWTDVQTKFEIAWNKIILAITGKIQTILETIKTVKQTISNFFNEDQTWPKAPTIPKLPGGLGKEYLNPKKMATGGIVTGPTFSLIGEAGSNEAVIPLNEQGLAPLINGVANAVVQAVQQTGIGQQQMQPVINVVLDGEVLSRATYKYNKNESTRSNSSFVTVK